MSDVWEERRRKEREAERIRKAKETGDNSYLYPKSYLLSHSRNVTKCKALMDDDWWENPASKNW